MNRHRTAGVAALACLLLALPAAAAPLPPCPTLAGNTVPAYGPIDGPPAVATWRDLDLSRAPACLGALRGRMELVVALAARFRSPASLEDMARRVGAISRTKGLRYWSVTDGDWRVLLSEAYALEGLDPENPRADFSAEEIFSGRALVSAQRDTRSTSLNRYRLVGRRAGPRRLVVESSNLTPLSVLIFELYAPLTLRVVHILDLLEPGLWAIYTVSAVQHGTLEQDPRSLVNRAAAYQRFLAGVPPERDPPVAP